MIANVIKTELQHAYCSCLPLLISASTRLGVYLPAPSSFSLASDDVSYWMRYSDDVSYWMRCHPITDITRYIPPQSETYAYMYVCIYV